MHRNLNLEAMPDGRTVLHVVFNDVARPADRWWLVISDDDPGHPVTVTMSSALATTTRQWLGHVTWDDAIPDGGIVVQGPGVVHGGVHDEQRPRNDRRPRGSVVDRRVLVCSDVGIDGAARRALRTTEGRGHG